MIQGRRQAVQLVQHRGGAEIGLGEVGIGNALDPHLVRAGSPGPPTPSAAAILRANWSGLMPVRRIDVAQVADALVQRRLRSWPSAWFRPCRCCATPCGLLRQDPAGPDAGRRRGTVAHRVRARRMQQLGHRLHSAVKCAGLLQHAGFGGLRRCAAAAGPVRAARSAAEEPRVVRRRSAAAGDVHAERRRAVALPGLARRNEQRGRAGAGAQRLPAAALHLAGAVEEAGDGVLLGLQARRRWP